MIHVYREIVTRTLYIQTQYRPNAGFASPFIDLSESARGLDGRLYPGQ